jgi:repressor LexA
MFIATLDHPRAPVSSSPASRFPQKGQYLAFIDTYTLLNRLPPAEADFQRFFGVSPPSVHQMIVQLERLGLIRRRPRQARSIELLVPPDQLPALQPINSPVAEYQYPWAIMAWLSTGSGPMGPRNSRPYSLRGSYGQRTGIRT